MKLDIIIYHTSKFMMKVCRFSVMEKGGVISVVEYPPYRGIYTPTHTPYPKYTKLHLKYTNYYTKKYTN